MILKIIQTLSVLFVFGLSGQVTATETSGHNALLFGLSPHLTKEQQAGWLPLIKHIEKQTNYPLHLQASPTIPVFENRLFAGKFDLAYINPKLFIEANRYVGYQPVVKEGQKELKAIIVVTKDSSYQSIKDLNGLRFISPENAFAASVLSRLNLYAQGVNVIHSYVETAAQGYSRVVAGSADAVGGEQQTFDKLPIEIKSKLKILWTSEGVTPYAFVIHPRVNTTVRKRMVEAILDFKDIPEGVAFFKKMNINPFVVAKNKDWDEIRQLMGE